MNINQKKWSVFYGARGVTAAVLVKVGKKTSHFTIRDAIISSISQNCGDKSVLMSWDMTKRVVFQVKDDARGNGQLGFFKLWMLRQVSSLMWTIFGFSCVKKQERRKGNGKTKKICLINTDCSFFQVCARLFWKYCNKYRAVTKILLYREILISQHPCSTSCVRYKTQTHRLSLSVIWSFYKMQSISP